MEYLDGQKVGHFLITIQKSFKLIINQLYTGMRFFRNFPEFRNFTDLRGHFRGNPRSGVIFMGGGGGG